LDGIVCVIQRYVKSPFATKRCVTHICIFLVVCLFMLIKATNWSAARVVVNFDLLSDLQRSPTLHLAVIIQCVIVTPVTHRHEVDHCVSYCISQWEVLLWF